MRVKKCYIVLLLLVLAACRTNDDLPCNGSGEDIIYEPQDKDSIFSPMAKRDTFIYLRTQIGQANGDTVIMVKKGYQKRYVPTQIRTNEECPLVYWDTRLEYQFADDDKDINLYQSISFSTIRVLPENRLMLNVQLLMHLNNETEVRYNLYSEMSPVYLQPIAIVLGKKYEDAIYIKSTVNDFVFKPNIGLVKFISGGYLFQLIP